MPLAYSNVYIALVHHPVYNQHRQIITTSITNLDVHDLARVTATYELGGYFIVQPLLKQRELAQQLMGFWKEGYGAKYNPDRQRAFERVSLCSNLQEVKDKITSLSGCPRVVATAAAAHQSAVGYSFIREVIQRGETFLLLFGTGWGLTKEVLAGSDYILAPIKGPGDYNHLSVRSAVSIIVDRLCGENWW